MLLNSNLIGLSLNNLDLAQEHVRTPERGEGSAAGPRVPDRAWPRLQQVQEETGQEVPGGRPVRHVHLQQVTSFRIRTVTLGYKHSSCLL